MNRLFPATELGRELHLYLDQLVLLLEFYEQLRLSPTRPQHALARVQVRPLECPAVLGQPRLVELFGVTDPAVGEVAGLRHPLVAEQVALVLDPHRTGVALYAGDVFSGQVFGGHCIYRLQLRRARLIGTGQGERVAGDEADEQGGPQKNGGDGEWGFYFRLLWGWCVPA